MSTPPLERKVQQLDNDVQAIYELISTISSTQRRHDNRFKEIAEQLEAHDARFDGIDGRLDGIDGRLDGIAGRLDGIAGSLGGVDGSLGGIDGHLEGVDGSLGGLGEQLTEVLELLRGR